MSIKPHKRVCKLQQLNPETIPIVFLDDETTKKSTTTSIPPPKVDMVKEQPVSSDQHSKQKQEKVAEVKKVQEKPHVQIPRVRSSRQIESIAETDHVKSTKEAPKAPKQSESESVATQEKPKEVVKDQPKVNPLLWQLHKKKMDGGTIQLGHLLDQHRYLMMENSTDPIPKVSVGYFPTLKASVLLSNTWKIQNKEILITGSHQKSIALERIWLFL